jgi:acyl-CoA synthetase (AMP-forming)/AMP-acid ligase II
LSSTFTNSDAKLPRNAANALWQCRDSQGSACIEPEGATTYAQLVERASTFAAALARHGIGRGDRVAICVERGAAAMAAYYGCLAAGAIAVIINDSLRPRQIESMLSDADASALISTRDVLTRQPRALLTTTRIFEIGEMFREPAMFEPLRMDVGDGAQIIYTSGSTGLPKGVLLTHGNLLANVRIVADYLGLKASDRTISLLPFSSVFGINQVICSVATAGTLIVERSPLPSRMVTTMRELGATVVAAVPPLWLQLLRTPDFSKPIESLRVLQCAGGYLPVSAVRGIRNAQPQADLFIMYGMTEIMRSTFLPPVEVDRRPDCMGLPIAESEVMVVRSDGTECDVDEPGELVHGGPTVAAGYWRQPDATAQTFRAHPRDPSRRVVFSGDIVRRDRDGYLYFVSRSDRLIKTLGNRVGPDEITDVLLASRQVMEAAVTTEADDVRGERIIAHVVLEPGGSLERLQQFCKLEMPRWMYPARFEVHDALPRMPNGKYDLQALKTGRSTVQEDAH